MSHPQQMTLPGLTPQWTLSDRLRKAREIAGLSQGEMAEAIGIARNSVGRYESGAYDPSRPVLIAWAFRTGVALDWIMSEADGDDDGPISAPVTGIPARMTGQPGTAEIHSYRKPLEERIPLRRTTPMTITPLADVITIWGAAA